MDTKGKIIYEETQQFRAGWLWALVCLAILSSIGITVGAILTAAPKRPELWWLLAGVVVLQSVFVYLFYITRFETTITTEGVYYKWWPFQRRESFVATNEILHASISKAPWTYGSQWLPGFGKVHNLSSGKGVAFVLKNGKKLFLGTQRESLFETALRKLNILS